MRTLGNDITFKINQYIENEGEVVAINYTDSDGYDYEELAIVFRKIGGAYLVEPVYDGEPGHSVTIASSKKVKKINETWKNKDAEGLFKILWAEAVPQ